MEPNEILLCGIRRLLDYDNKQKWTMKSIDGGKSMTIDIEKLREDLKQECYGAFFVGGFGGALIESFDVESASPQKLIEMAEDKGIDLKKYETVRCW